MPGLPRRLTLRFALERLGKNLPAGKILLGPAPVRRLTPLGTSRAFPTSVHLAQRRADALALVAQSFEQIPLRGPGFVTSGPSELASALGLPRAALVEWHVSPKGDDVITRATFCGFPLPPATLRARLEKAVAAVPHRAARRRLRPTVLTPKETEGSPWVGALAGPNVWCLTTELQDGATHWWICLQADGELGVRDRAALNQLRPAIHRRLVAENRLNLCGVLHRAIEELVHLAGMELMVLRDGCVRFAVPQAASGSFDEGWETFPLLDANQLLVARRTTRMGLRAHLDRVCREWRLSPREREVLAILVAGEPNREAALRLGCTVRTIEFHITNILRKSGLRRRGELAGAILRRL